jgi:hypothetical protein
MKDAFSRLFQSKKFWMSILTLIGMIIAKYLGDTQLSLQVMGLGTIVIGAFGLQEHGEVAASIKADAEVSKVLAHNADREING